MISNSNFDDKDFDFFVERLDMSDTESVYYYIRNSFAHGSFKIENGVYRLESKKDDTIKAQARIKENTLKKLVEFKNQKIKDIKNYNKSKCKIINKKKKAK